VQRSSKAVADEYEGSQLSVADMSAETGGPILMHRSHQNGRDVDLVYYAMDAEGAPFSPDSHMAYYNSQGLANYAKSPMFIKNIKERYFDLKRNWALVRAMILDPEVTVEHIFVSNRVKRWLLRYAKEAGEEQALIKKASLVMHAPRKVKGHNDHMHVRIACPADDIAAGRCRSQSAPRPKRGNRWHRQMVCPRPVETPVLPQI
jgi:penicillin-insensitive murein DD-endopeptidase